MFCGYGTYVTGTRQAKELPEARSGDIAVDVVEKVADAAEPRATRFSRAGR